MSTAAEAITITTSSHSARLAELPRAGIGSRICAQMIIAAPHPWITLAAVGRSTMCTAIDTPMIAMP